MMKSILLSVSILFLLSSCAEPDVIYRDRTFPYIPEHVVEKRVFPPLTVDYEVYQ